MTKKLIVACSLLALLSCQQKEQDTYQVKGTIKNATAPTVYLEEVSMETMQPVIVDSAVIAKDGSFDLSTLSKEETIFNLRLPGNRYPFVSFINDTKSITVHADFKNFNDPYTLQGSPASQSLKEFLFTIGQKINALNSLAPPADTANYKKMQRDSIRFVVADQRKAAQEDLQGYATSFISNSNHPALALYALGSYQSIAGNPGFGIAPLQDEEVKNILAGALKKFPGNKALAAINLQLQGNGATGKRTTAPDFTLPDVNGKPVSLSSFRGRYVLVDFWASWCAPCRAENPNVVSAYNKFKDKNFTVLGVSLDREDGKEAWLQAIREDGLAWTHVSDLKFWDSMVVPLYGIEGIPYNVLLDPGGNVIAEDLRGPDLHRKLAEVIK